MKSWIFIGIACALSAPWLRAQTLSNDSEQKARDLLRSVVEERERQLNPPKQAPAPIYTSSNTTQIAPAKTAPLAPAPVVTAPTTTAPVVAARTQPAPAITAPAPTMSAPSTPAPAVGAPDASTEESLGPTGYQTFPHPPTYAEVERDYLAGKITAKQFQRYLRDHTLDPVSPGSKHPNALARTYESPRSNPNSPLRTTPQPAPAVSPSTAPAEVQPERNEPATDSGNLNDLEKKMDELLRLKTAREQASLNAAVTNAVAAPKTKRERLDALLRLYLTGKISEPEYNEQRAKLISETGK